jgi:hypothetical protein
MDGEAAGRVVFALVAQRALEPGSKLAATRWGEAVEFATGVGPVLRANAVGNGAPLTRLRCKLLVNRAWVATLAGRLAFFDLRDVMGARSDCILHSGLIRPPTGAVRADKLAHQRRRKLLVDVQRNDVGVEDDLLHPQATVYLPWR